MQSDAFLDIPDLDIRLWAGSIVQLGRFNSDRWVVRCGWYAVNGNREVYGWYLVRHGDGMIKPLQRTDLDDIYMIETK